MNLLYKRFILSISFCLPLASLNGQTLKMNQTQVIGSHNSYKIGIEKPLMDIILAERPEAIGLEYTHISITQQLDLGLRGLEIDVLYDPDGGRFSKPKSIDMLKAQGIEAKPYDAKLMNDPGFKVLHIPDIDFRTHCSTFKVCLSDISQDHIALICRLSSLLIQRVQGLVGLVSLRLSPLMKRYWMHWIKRF